MTLIMHFAFCMRKTAQNSSPRQRQRSSQMEKVDEKEQITINSFVQSHLIFTKFTLLYSSSPDPSSCLVNDSVAAIEQGLAFLHTRGTTLCAQFSLLTPATCTPAVCGAICWLACLMTTLPSS